MLKPLVRFAPALAGRRRALAAVFALGLVGAAVSLATPLLGKAFVDAVTVNRDFSMVPWLAAALVAIAVVDVALATVSGRLHARVSAAVLADLRARLFARCMDGPLASIESFRHGDLLTRFGTDVPRIQTLLVDGLLGAIQNALFLGVAAAITFALSPALALWSFAGVAAALAATALFRRPIETRTLRVRVAMADLSHFLSERLGALRAVRLHRAEREDASRLDAASARLNDEVVGFQTLDAVATGVPGLALALSLAWIYVAGGRLLEDGAITLGTFVAFVLYQGRLFGPAQGLLALVRSLQEAGVSVARVAEMLGDEAAPATAAVAGPACAPGAPAIALRGVVFAYPGKPAVFDHVDLAIAPGERVALFGASGAGKSTLVQLLFGLRAPAMGSLAVAGASPCDAAARGALGYAGAEPFLLHASVDDNLRYGNPGATREEVDRALSLAAADGFVAALPEGRDTVIGGRGLALSDGQRQRLGLARLFLRAPPVLVLDEAFSALDLDTELAIRAAMWRAFNDRTAIVISHRPVGLDAFDRILFLHDGRFAPVTAAALAALIAPDRGRVDRTMAACAR